MAKQKVFKLGELQLKIMKILWESAETDVGDVHQALSREGSWAYTTIATMLRKMEARGLVRHRVVDRKFLYRPAVKSGEVARNLSAHLLERLFEGSLADMVAHLLTTGQVSRHELDRLEKLISERKKKP
jgi:BlaI family transcriptional regulator, penicillinase repressor